MAEKHPKFDEKHWYVSKKLKGIKVEKHKEIHTQTYYSQSAERQKQRGRF